MSPATQYQKPAKRLKRFYLPEPFKGIYLTQREYDAVKLCSYYDYKTIGRIMQVSPRTVEFYLKNVRCKLGCKNKKMLISTLKEHGIVKHCQQQAIF